LYNLPLGITVRTAFSTLSIECYVALVIDFELSTDLQNLAQCPLGREGSLFVPHLLQPRICGLMNRSLHFVASHKQEVRRTYLFSNPDRHIHGKCIHDSRSAAVHVVDPMYILKFGKILHYSGVYFSIADI
jgi:hypothetical protein